MRRFTAEPSHHPIAWLLIPAGLLVMVWGFTSAEGSSSLLFLALGLGLATDGLAEVLPARQRRVIVGLRVVSLVSLCVVIVTAVLRIVFRITVS